MAFQVVTCWRDASQTRVTQRPWAWGQCAETCKLQILPRGDSVFNVFNVFIDLFRSVAQVKEGLEEILSMLDSQEPELDSLEVGGFGRSWPY